MTATGPGKQAEGKLPVWDSEGSGPWLQVMFLIRVFLSQQGLVHTPRADRDGAKSPISRLAMAPAQHQGSLHLQRRRPGEKVSSAGSKRPCVCKRARHRGGSEHGLQPATAHPPSRGGLCRVPRSCNPSAKAQLGICSASRFTDFLTPVLTQSLRAGRAGQGLPSARWQSEREGAPLVTERSEGHWPHCRLEKT